MPNRNRRRLPRGPREPRGFSLIEFTLVLALIGLLAGVVTFSARSVMTRGKQNAARGEIATICQALETYYTAFGQYPSNEEGLAALCRRNDRFADPLLSQTPVDPWGRPYSYLQPGRDHAYEVICLGADGREGGAGSDADIVSWDLKERAKGGG